MPWLTVNQPALAARAVLDEAPAIVLPNGSRSSLWRRLSMRRGVFYLQPIPRHKAHSCAPMLACMDMDVGR